MLTKINNIKYHQIRYCEQNSTRKSRSNSFHRTKFKARERERERERSSQSQQIEREREALKKWECVRSELRMGCSWELNMNSAMQDWKCSFSADIIVSVYFVVVNSV